MPLKVETGTLIEKEFHLKVTNTKHYLYACAKRSGTSPLLIHNPHYTLHSITVSLKTLKHSLSIPVHALNRFLERHLASLTDLTL